MAAVPIPNCVHQPCASGDGSWFECLYQVRFGYALRERGWFRIFQAATFLL